MSWFILMWLVSGAIAATIAFAEEYDYQKTRFPGSPVYVTIGDVILWLMFMFVGMISLLYVVTDKWNDISYFISDKILKRRLFTLK